MSKRLTMIRNSPMMRSRAASDARVILAIVTVALSLFLVASAGAALMAHLSAIANYIYWGR